MAKRFVRARPKTARVRELYDRLDSGEIASMEPFGNAITKALMKARFDPDTGEAVWIEEDYCTPPLAMEREAVLDDYFEELTIVREDADEPTAWGQIEHFPRLFDHVLESR